MKTPITKIIVNAKSERGRWRAGLHFTRETVELDVSVLGDAKVEAIAADPELVVAFVAEPEADRKAREAAEKAEAEKKAREAAEEAKAAKKAEGDAKGSADKRSPEQIKADVEALGREREATKNKKGKEAWVAAEVAARESMGASPEHWASLAYSDRVARIEAKLGEAAGK